VRAVLLASGGPDETLPVLTAARHLGLHGHDVRLGLPRAALPVARAGGHEAVAVDGFPAPEGADVDAVRELCLDAELVVGTLSTEDVAATMAAFAGVPYAGLHLSPRVRRRRRAEWGGRTQAERARLLRCAPCCTCPAPCDHQAWPPGGPAPRRCGPGTRRSPPARRRSASSASTPS